MGGGDFGENLDVIIQQGLPAVAINPTHNKRIITQAQIAKFEKIDSLLRTHIIFLILDKIDLRYNLAGLCK